MRLGEDRHLFKQAMQEVGAEVPRSARARSLDEAERDRARRSASRSSSARPSRSAARAAASATTAEELRARSSGTASRESPAHEVLIEESVLGWKEFELEVMRDTADNVIVVCSIENFDAMGVHTGDSITVAPQMTLSDREYQAMRDDAKAVIRNVGVDTGGSNIQFAVDPKTGRRVVIEMNPRVSRSSALASKATGFPIAKIAALLAVGYHLDEIPNDITKKTPASFEPTLDYVVVKIPRWTFEKFPRRRRAADDPDEVGRRGDGDRPHVRRGARKGGALARDRPRRPRRRPRPAAARGAPRELEVPTAERLFLLRRAFAPGMDVEEVAALTRIDPWFLDGVRRMVEAEEAFAGRAARRGPPRSCATAKRLGLSDRTARAAAGRRPSARSARGAARSASCPSSSRSTPAPPSSRRQTPYLYSTYEDENESDPHRQAEGRHPRLGPEPHRPGHRVRLLLRARVLRALRGRLRDRHDQLQPGDGLDRLRHLRPPLLRAAHASRTSPRSSTASGRTASSCSSAARRRSSSRAALDAAGVPIWGTSPEAIDLAEDRERFGEPARRGEPAAAAARRGHATSPRRSRRAGGSAFRWSCGRPTCSAAARWRSSSTRARLARYVEAAVAISGEHPVLIDRFLEDAFELDVDALCDGTATSGRRHPAAHRGGGHPLGRLVRGAAAVEGAPPDLIAEIREATRRLAVGLVGRGLHEHPVRDPARQALRPRGQPARLAHGAVRLEGDRRADGARRGPAAAGRPLSSLGLPPERDPVDFFIKAPVFPFRKFPGEDMLLGPEMKSTGEVMGVSPRFGDAFAKACEAVGTRLPLSGRAFLTVNPYDKAALMPIGRELADLGFALCATAGTREALREAGVEAEHGLQGQRGPPERGRPHGGGRDPARRQHAARQGLRFDEAAIRAAALRLSIPCLTTLSAATAAVEGIRSRQEEATGVAPLQEYHRG